MMAKVELYKSEITWHKMMVKLHSFLHDRFSVKLSISLL